MAVPVDEEDCDTDEEGNPVDGETDLAEAMPEPDNGSSSSEGEGEGEGGDAAPLTPASRILGESNKEETQEAGCGRPASAVCWHQVPLRGADMENSLANVALGNIIKHTYRPAAVMIITPSHKKHAVNHEFVKRFTVARQPACTTMCDVSMEHQFGWKQAEVTGLTRNAARGSPKWREAFKAMHNDIEKLRADEQCDHVTFWWYCHSTSAQRRASCGHRRGRGVGTRCVR